MKKLLLFLALLALVILAWCCIYKSHSKQIPQDITERTQQALQQAKLSQLFSHVDGRDVYLSANGLSETEQNSLLEIVEGIWGVRKVYFSDKTEAVRRPEPSLNIDYNGDVVSLSGMLASDSEVNTLINAIKTTLGYDITIENNLKTGSSVVSLPMLKASLIEFVNLSSGILNLNNKVLRLSGEAANPRVMQISQKNFEELSLAYSDFTFETDLQLAASYDDQACQQRLNTIINSSSILFQSGKADIRRDSYPLLKRLSVAAQRCEAVVHVKGHTDSKGEADFNFYLSQQRAESVKQYLIGRGVSKVRIKASGYGETQPVADNNTETGRAMNRRIEFNVE